MSKRLIEIRSLSKHFGSVIALSGVSLDVLAGEVHCLLGDNGAGKSTLIKILSGVYAPSSGEIHFDGKVVRRDGIFVPPELEPLNPDRLGA